MRLGILGTRYLMEGTVYSTKIQNLGMDYLIPDEQERKHINSIIFDELVKGKFSSRSLEYFSEVINSFKDQGCDAAVLGCTEIPLLVSKEDSSLPILDSTRILAKAALKKALL